jgi:biopolymer transport protein ExbB/TolQ
MTMESLADILEQELEEAVEVKNKRSLHRYITLLTENLVRQDRNEREHSEFREAIIRIDTRIEEGFKRMDQRFESMQSSMDKRFDMMFKFMTTGFVILATMMSVYQFLA